MGRIALHGKFSADIGGHRFGRTTTESANSTYNKLAVQWLNDSDSYRDCASYHPDNYREW